MIFFDWLYRLFYCSRRGHFYTAYGFPESDDYCAFCGKRREDAYHLRRFHAGVGRPPKASPERTARLRKLPLRKPR